MTRLIAVSITAISLAPGWVGYDLKNSPAKLWLGCWLIASNQLRTKRLELQ